MVASSLAGAPTGPGLTCTACFGNYWGIRADKRRLADSPDSGHSRRGGPWAAGLLLCCATEQSQNSRLPKRLAQIYAAVDCPNSCNSGLHRADTKTSYGARTTVKSMVSELGREI